MVYYCGLNDNNNVPHLQSITVLIGSESDSWDDIRFIASRKFFPWLQSNSGKGCSFSPSLSFMPRPQNWLSTLYTTATQDGPVLFKEICHGGIFHTLESGWLALKAPAMLGGVAGAALCCTALSQAIRGRCGRQASTKCCCMRRGKIAFLVLVYIHSFVLN